ncbi:ATPase [Pseudomonas sp. PvP001]|uniref:ATPase n=1 Tax=Pseudomonas sp. PvP001 TaxID=3158559 RepID=UPI00106F2328
MRKDARDDFDDNLPSLRGDTRDDDDFSPVGGGRERDALYSRNTPVVRVKAPSTGALWALIGALFIALGGLGWWSFQQINLMEQQLVATQESFARISEEAAGRLQDISGKVANTQSTAVSGSEAMRAEIKQLQEQLAQQTQQQSGVAGQQSTLQTRLEQAASQVAAQQALNEQLQAQLKSLGSDLAALKQAQPDTGKLQARLDGLDGELAALKKSNPSAQLERLEQDLIVLKSEQENRPATSSGPSVNEFDAFRGQATRSLTTLQSQVQNLQQQISQLRR